MNWTNSTDSNLFELPFIDLWGIMGAALAVILFGVALGFAVNQDWAVAILESLTG